MKIIKRNRSCFPSDTRMYQMMKSFRKEVAEEWIEWSEIRVLPADKCLFTSEAESVSIEREFALFLNYSGGIDESLQVIDV